MKTITTRTLELSGTYYEIGRALGRIAATQPAIQNFHTAGHDGFGTAEVNEAKELFAEWCPGLNEELAGFSDELKAPLESVVYYAMTYLKPNCSQAALLPSKTANGHPLLARSYEFNDEFEDFQLMKTCVKGKYTHMGTSVLNFGREDGFNEHGLGITMSSCGFPVGANANMRQPRIKGLQYWAVLRTLLENCRDTKEALLFLKGMPIAYNLNMILLDRTGNGALVETLDGRMAVRSLDESAPHPYVHATNHAVIAELAAIEPEAMVHSLKRYQLIQDTMDHTEKVTASQLKDMLLAPYPDGLCCHYYKDFFGTTKSMVIDLEDGIIDLCWGGRKENGWHTYRLSDSLPTSEETACIENKPAAPAMFQFAPSAHAFTTETDRIETD